MKKNNLSTDLILDSILIIFVGIGIMSSISFVSHKIYNHIVKKNYKECEEQNRIIKENNMEAMITFLDCRLNVHLGGNKDAICEVHLIGETSCELDE